MAAGSHFGFGPLAKNAQILVRDMEAKLFKWSIKVKSIIKPWLPKSGHGSQDYDLTMRLRMITDDA